MTNEFSITTEFEEEPSSKIKLSDVVAVI